MDPAATHLEALVWAVASTSGPVLEVGGGFYSTPVLAGFARAGRQVWCEESDPSWRAELESRWGEHVSFVENAPEEPWAVVLVDHRPPEARAEMVNRHKGRAVVVVHDTEPENAAVYPGLADAVAGGCTFDTLEPWTTVMTP